MLKYITVCAVFLFLGTGSVEAQQQDIVLHKIEVPGADFGMVVVMSKAQAAVTNGLSSPGNSLVVRPTGDEPASATEAEIEKIFGSSQYLIHAFRVEPRGGGPSYAVHVYVVSKGARTPLDKHSQCDRSPPIF